MSRFQELLKKQIVICDGAMGTELQRYGMPPGACPEAWCLKNPQALTEIHRSYVRSGANIIYTGTFGANRLKLNSYKIKSVRQVNRDLARLALKAAGRKALVAGDIGPTGQFVEPFGPLSFEAAVDIFKEQIQGLLEAGVDLLAIETMMDIQEARAALLAAKELTRKDVLVTLTFEKNNRTLNGTDPASAAITLAHLGAAAVGCNCSAGPREMIPLIRQMRKATHIALIAKPNAGMPILAQGRTVFNMSAQAFAAYGPKLIDAGASVLGGCCGTTPQHIVRLKASLKTLKPRTIPKRNISAVSSAQSHVIFDDAKKPVVIGECINPTGRPALREELKNGQTTLVRTLALEQKTRGAYLLDVNVGVANTDEVSLLVKTVKLLSVSSPLPLVLDTSNPRALEAGLRVYPGRALINSISGEPKKMFQMMTIAKKYGAMFILLPIEKKVPQTFLERRGIIQRMLKKALKKGFAKHDMIVDGLVMTVASDENAAIETLKTIRFCHKVLKIKTVCGLSNVSFGMPHRALLNNSFFALLKDAGLSCVIANPAQLLAKKSKPAVSVLLAQDQGARRYIARFQNQKESKVVRPSQKIKDIRCAVYEAIVQGDNSSLVSDLKNLMNTMPALAIVDTIIVPAMNAVGAYFERKEYFLPQLIASAETAKQAFKTLKPFLEDQTAKPLDQTVVILATVQGDIHDIGKNIVALMLKNHGFNVIDLGKDVSAQRIIKEAQRHQSPIIGLSALMTTTMINMEEVIRLAKQRRLKCRFMLGGAVVTSEYAHSLGADYSKDGVEAVRVASRLKSMS